MNPRKLEHRFRMILAGIPYAFLYGHQDNDVPTFWLLLYRARHLALGLDGQKTVSVVGVFAQRVM